MALYTGASIRASPVTGRCSIGTADCGGSSSSSNNMSTANGADLRSRITPPSDPRCSRKDNCGRITDSRISTTTGSRQELSEMTNGTSVPLKSGTKEDVIAMREVEFIASFPVSGEDQDAKTEYVRRHLTDIKFISKTRPVNLIISLTGIKVSDISGETTLMAHALKRIAFATCFPEHRQFSFIAREPRAAAEDQYCHAFLARSSREADELNTLVATAFRTAYAQSQSASTPSNDTIVPPPAVPAGGIATAAATQLPQPLTPLPVAASASPPSFHDVVRAQLETQRDEPTDRKEAFASRLSQISTPHVDRLANERRQRRHRELSAEGVLPASASDSRLQQQRGASPATDSTPLPSAGDPSHPPAPQRARKSHESPELRRGNSESPPSMNGCVVAARLPQPSSSSSSSSSNLPSCATAGSNGVTSSADAALMSNLLRILRGSGTEARPHGSPVMILKDLIDRHFSNGGELAGILPMPPIEEFECRRPQTLTAAPSTVSGRSEATAVTTRNSPSSRSRPLSDVFVSNGEIFLRSQAVENGGGGGASETPVRTESQRPADSANDGSPTKAWYQPGIPRDTVLDMLAQQDVGYFVVRDSTTHPGCYALSMRVPKYETTDQGIAHYLITKTSRGTVKLKGMSKEWNSLSALVTHHTVMRELLPCQLVLPRSSGAVGGGVALNGAERYDRSNSEC